MQLYSVCWVCVLQLYWIHWLVLAVFGRFYKYKIISSSDKDFFLSCLDAFSFSLPDCSAYDFSIMFNKNMILSAGLSSLLCWGTFLYMQFVEHFYHKRMLNFVKFFCIYWDENMIFIFHSINLMCHIYWFVYLNHSCISGINLTWSWCMILLMCSWI